MSVRKKQMKQQKHLASPSRRSRHAADTRVRLYRCALRLFAERGYFATTIEDITEAADLGKGTFFNYFPSKEHVLSTFGDQRLAFFEHALDQVRSGKSSVLQTLTDAVTALSALDQAEAGLLRSIFAAHACSDSVRTHYRERITRCQRIISTILVIGQNNGDVRTDRGARQMARIMQQAMLGVTMAWAMNPEEPLSRISHNVWNALWESFRAPNLLSQASPKKQKYGGAQLGTGRQKQAVT